MKHFVVVGLGSIGRRHLTNLASRYPEARFTVVRHRGGEDDLCTGLGARVVTDVRDLVDEHVDLAIVATPSANHIDSLPWLIAAGWPLLVEKPVVTTADHCDELERLLAAAPPAIRAVGFNMRHLPSVRRIKEALDAAELGHVVRASFVAGQWLPDWRPDVDYRTVYSADARRGGGVELDLSHEFDLARWFFGELDVDYASAGQFSELEIESHDTSVAVLSPCTAPSPIVTVSLDYVARQRVRWYEVVGDRGRIEWDITGSLRLMTAAGASSLPATDEGFDVGATYLSLIDGVMHAIDTGDHRRVQPLEDGLSSTRLALHVRDRGGRS